MNFIVFTRFVTPLEGASRLAVALHCLGTWYDAEVGNLEDLLDTVGHEDGIDDLDVLHSLHLEADAGPEEIRRLLETGLASLERLLARLRSTPRSGLTEPVLDAWLRQTEARLAATGAAVGRALAA